MRQIRAIEVSAGSSAATALRVRRTEVIDGALAL
jgi:hypothetical protein